MGKLIEMYYQCQLSKLRVGALNGNAVYLVSELESSRMRVDWIFNILQLFMLLAIDFCSHLIYLWATYALDLINCECRRRPNR